MFEICDSDDAHELSATRIHELRSLVQQLTGEPIEELWISIINEELVLLKGRCARAATRDLAAQAIRRVAPDAAIENRIEVVADQNPGSLFRTAPRSGDRKRRSA